MKFEIFYCKINPLKYCRKILLNLIILKLTQFRIKLNNNYCFEYCTKEEENISFIFHIKNQNLENEDNKIKNEDSRSQEKYDSDDYCEAYQVREAKTQTKITINPNYKLRDFENDTQTENFKEKIVILIEMSMKKKKKKLKGLSNGLSNSEKIFKKLNKEYIENFKNTKNNDKKSNSQESKKKTSKWNKIIIAGKWLKKSITKNNRRNYIYVKYYNTFYYILTPSFFIFILWVINKPLKYINQRYPSNTITKHLLWVNIHTSKLKKIEWNFSAYENEYDLFSYFKTKKWWYRTITNAQIRWFLKKAFIFLLTFHFFSCYQIQHWKIYTCLLIEVENECFTNDNNFA